MKKLMPIHNARLLVEKQLEQSEEWHAAFKYQISQLDTVANYIFNGLYWNGEYKIPAEKRSPRMQ